MRGLSVTAQISAQNQPITVQPKKKLSRKIASALWPRAMAMIAGKKNIAVRMVSSIIVNSSASSNVWLSCSCRKVTGVVNRTRRAQEHAMTDLGAAYGRLSANVRGALWMLASAVTFTLMTSLIKYLGDDYSPALQTFYRQAAGMIVLLPLILRDPAGSFRTTRPGILLFRSLAGTLGMILAFWAYQEMPLAEANALSFTRTLWIVPLAIFVLDEKIGPWRLGATIVGFLGVLIMLQPSIANAVGWPAAAALASAALFA